MRAHSPEGVDGVVDLFVAVVQKAIADVKRGPGYHKRQREYQSAHDFLARLDLLKYIPLDDPEAEALVDEVV